MRTSWSLKKLEEFFGQQKSNQNGLPKQEVNKMK